MTPSLEHVAIIMDGNGRWAKRRSHIRIWGHIRGANTVSKIIEEADALGIKALTLFAFSTENWSRPLEEINVLFKLLKKFLKREKAKIVKNRIRFKIIGEISFLPEETQVLIADLENSTAMMEGLQLTFAFNYGARQSLVKQVNEFIERRPGVKLTEETLQELMEVPDVDLLIRTSGDQRISNFLLWQLAYSELYFTNILWPNFTCQDFRRIIKDFCSRERRFGGLSPEQSWDTTKNLAEKNKQVLMTQARGQHVLQHH